MAAYSAQVASYERKTHRFGTDLRKSGIHHTQEGLQSAKAPMMFFAIKKVWESTMRISPPLVRLVGAIASIFQVYLGGLFTQHRPGPVPRMPAGRPEDVQNSVR
jgi:hypothetical protein